MDNDILINLPLVDQFKDTEDENWKKYSCGICAVKMMMLFKKPDLMSVSVMTLVKKCLDTDGYIEDIGWRHQSLVNLAREYGVFLQYQKEFFKTPEEKEEGVGIIRKELENKRPIVVSIFRNFDTNKGSHLVVVRGFKETDGKILGFYIQDPDPRDRGNNFSVSKEEFLVGWRGGMIWFAD